MNDDTNRKWLVIAGIVLVAMVSIWVLAVFQLKPAAAGGSRIALSLRSRLTADYGADAGQSLGSLSLSIVSDMMEDLGMGRLVAEEYSDEMRVALLTPVPTATALNFEGDLPPSVTPSNTSLPTDTPSNTPTLTPTATNTRRPTQTYTASPTKAGPTAKPVTATSACVDCKKPTIIGATLSPSGGDLGVCSSSMVVNISNMQVIDPAFSSGMKWVGVKYRFEISGGVYNYVQLSQTGGPGMVGNQWDATYGGPLTINFAKKFGSAPAAGKSLAKAIGNQSQVVGETDTPTPTNTPLPPTDTPVPADTSTPTPTVYTIKVHGKAEDNAGNISYLEIGTFTCTN